MKTSFTRNNQIHLHVTISTVGNILHNKYINYVKGSKITSTSSRGKSTDLQRMEGISIDKNDNGSEIPAIITDN